MIRKVLFAVFVDRATQGLTAIVVDLVSLEDVEVEELFLDDWLRIVEPTGKSPLELERLSVEQMIVEITVPLVNALTVLKDVHVLELETGQHRGFELFEVANIAYLRHDFLLEVCGVSETTGTVESIDVASLERPARSWQTDIRTSKLPVISQSALWHLAVAAGGRQQRADETENRTGTDGRPEAEQSETGQQVRDAGDGQRVEGRVEEQAEEDQPEATTDRTRKKRADDADAGDGRQQHEGETGADKADQDGGEKASSESAGEGHETKRGQQEHEKKDLGDEANQHVCFSVF